MKSSDRVALSLSACEAADRQDPETEDEEAVVGGGREGRTGNHCEADKLIHVFLWFS